MKVKRHSQVSYATVLRRLLDMGEVDNSIWQPFGRYHRFKTGRSLSRKTEPYPLTDYDFSERRLDQLVRDALELELIRIDRAGEIHPFLT